MKNFRAGFGVFFVEKRIFEKDNRNLLKIGASPEAHGTTAIRAARNITLFPTFLSKRKMGS